MSTSKGVLGFVNTIGSAKGNLTAEAKERVVAFYNGATEGASFCRPIAQRLEAVEANLYDKPEEPGKQEVKLVFEIDVTQGQLASILCRAP